MKIWWLIRKYYWWRYDAVTYLKYLDTLRVSESHRSVWIFAESSYKIFEYAKKRVYRFVKSDGTKLSSLSKTSTSKKRKLKDAAEDVKGWWRREAREALLMELFLSNIIFPLFSKLLLWVTNSFSRAYIDAGAPSFTIVLDEVLEEAPKWKVLRVSEWVPVSVCYIFPRFPCSCNLQVNLIMMIAFAVEIY